MEAEVLKKLVAQIEKNIADLAVKGDITPSETKAAKDGMELREMLKCEIENCQMQENAERGYSGHERPYREYTITSYGRPVRMNTPMRSYDGYSGDYGVQGWYRSDNDMSHCYGNDPDYSERRRYSRHSIGDRAVEKLENMMDNAGSDYEREELRKFIHMIRNNAD